jgi:hypothetical protein
MAYSFYIYYRIDLARAAECERRIRELFAAMRKATGVSGQLMKKRGESNLWMEIYLDVADDAKFEWELAETAGRLNIAEFLLPGTPRHAECFEHP